MAREQGPDEKDRRTLDPGAYIGSEAEREAETIPGGLSDRDERIAAYDSQSGVPGEPDDGNALVGDTDDIVEEETRSPSRPDGSGSS